MYLDVLLAPNWELYLDNFYDEVGALFIVSRWVSISLNQVLWIKLLLYKVPRGPRKSQGLNHFPESNKEMRIFEWEQYDIFFLFVTFWYITVKLFSWPGHCDNYTTNSPCSRIWWGEKLNKLFPEINLVWSIFSIF